MVFMINSCYCFAAGVCKNVEKVMQQFTCCYISCERRSYTCIQLYTKFVLIICIITFNNHGCKDIVHTIFLVSLPPPLGIVDKMTEAQVLLSPKSFWVTALLFKIFIQNVQVYAVVLDRATSLY